MGLQTITQVWCNLWVGDAPGNRVLTLRGNGRGHVSSFRPDGGSTPRSVNVGSEVLTVDAPTFDEHILAEGTFADIADQLATSEWHRVEARRAELEKARTVTEQPLGTVTDVLRDALDGGALEPGDAATARVVLDGAQVRCRRCGGDGFGRGLSCHCSSAIAADGSFLELDPDPDCPDCDGRGRSRPVCLRCAGVGRLHSQVDVQLHTATLDDLDHDVATHRFAPDEVGVWTATSALQVADVPDDVDDLARWQTADRRERVVQPRWLAAASDRHVMVAGHLSAYDPQRRMRLNQRTSRIDATKVLDQYLRLLPAHSHPDRTRNYAERDWSTEQRRDLLDRYEFDATGRVVAARWRVLPDADLDAVWQRIIAALPALEATLCAEAGDDWSVQLQLATEFIATGEHGPQLSVVAQPPNPVRRPIALSSSVDHALEHVVFNVWCDLACGAAARRAQTLR